MKLMNLKKLNISNSKVCFWKMQGVLEEDYYGMPSHDLTQYPKTTIIVATRKDQEES